ncbi:MAG: hypothetical protein H0T50_10140 [Gemmatimonadales bacterium]|nr:hypothetical protein [Gemmatimonadales bacterium]
MGAPRLDRWTYISSGLPVGLALGAGIWLVFAAVTGRHEPWDSAGVSYPAALLCAGAIGGFMVPGHWAEVAVGIFSGQAVVLLARVLLDPASGGLWPLGMLFLGVYSLLALIGAGLGSGLRRVLGG